VTVTPKNIYQMRVRDVMVTHVVAVNPRDPVNDALQLMVENRLSALPVVDGHDRCVGVISATDLLEEAQELGGELTSLGTTEGLEHEMLLEKLQRIGFSDEVVQEVMTHTPIAVDAEATLVSAAATMVRNRVHHLAVTDAQRKLRGIISTMDILRALAESQP
jgi:CBS domain-containing protein